jgi:putative ABC transport system permease protein
MAAVSSERVAMSAVRKRWADLFAVVCIALGTAAVSAVLGLVDATLARPLPFPAAERLVRIWIAEDQGDPRIDLSLPEMIDLKRELRSVDVFAGAARSRLVARLPGATERLRGEAIDADYFPLLGLQPLHGRGFVREDFAADAAPTVLLSHALWSRHYGANPEVLGSTLTAGDAALRIVGVLPPGFEGTIENDVIDVWIPQTHYQPANLRQNRESRLGWSLARLAPGATPAALQAELDAIQARWRETYPNQYRATRLRSEAFGENWRAPLRQNAGLLLAAVFVLLAIAVANVAALLLARALDRKQELALRSALGASRIRIAALLLRETASLALLCGTLGAVAAPWLLQGLLALAPLSLPGYLDLSFDVGSAVLAILTVALTAGIAAAIPAWSGSRVAPQAALAGAGRGSSLGRSDRRLWSALIAGEIALSFALLVGGALLMRSYYGLATLDLGFRQEGVLRLAITLSEADYGTRERLPALQAQIRSTLEAQPGVRTVGLVAPTLPPWDAFRPALRHAALALDPDASGLRVGEHAIDSGLLATLDIPVLAGRAFDTSDRGDTAPVAMLSAALAQRLGGDTSVLGSEITLDGRNAGTYRVIGIVGDVAWDGVAEQDTGRYIRYGANDDAHGGRHDVYLALTQVLSPVVSIGVHSALPPEQMIEPLRRALAQLAPASAVHWISTMDEELAGEYAGSRFYLTLMAVFGMTALLLAGVGLFALLSHALLKRQQEIGIRLAMGADAARVVRLLLGDGVRLLLFGLALGIALSVLTGAGLTSQLHGVDRFDPLAYAGAGLLLLAVTLLALLPALRRALRLPASLALRGE